MHLQFGKQIASLLIDTAQAIITEHDPHTIAQHPLIFRVGSGKATYFKASRQSRWSLREMRVITIGAGMVVDKAISREHASRWRTGKEILGRAYWQGELTLQSVLAHTILHEYAHYLQHIRGLRRHGSVHDAGFYHCLDALYATQLPQYLMQALNADAEFAQLRFEKNVAEVIHVPSVKHGDEVMFAYRGEQQWGTIVRVNRTRHTVRLACDTKMYVPKSLILAVR